MILTSEQIIGLQKCELEMLKSFVFVCKQLELNYYLIGGTLIGAIRHSGFIPWDDDIDIAMPRKDYDIFVEKAQEYMPDNLFIQTNESDPDYCNCFAKIRNSDTIFVESSVKSRKINHGVYIDIFPLDYYPSNKIKKRVIDIKDTLLSSSIGRLYDTNSSKRFGLGQFFSLVLYPSPIKAVSKRAKYLKKQKKSKYYRNYCGAWGKKEVWPSEWFGSGTKATFEDINVIVPSNYDAVLYKVYGDYMQLPPEEKRVAHHFCEKIDLTESYQKYI